MIEKLFNRQAQETEEHWVSISDVMAGLMVIFLFIAISYMVNANQKPSELLSLKLKLQIYLMHTEICRDALSKELA